MDETAVQAFLRVAVSQKAVPWPEKFNVDGNTLAGVELAHRVRKQQYSLPTGMKGRAVLALPLPLRWQAQDAFTGDLP